MYQFRNKAGFYGEEELLASRPTPKLEDHTLSAVRDCLFSVFAAALHTGGRSFSYGSITKQNVDLSVNV